MKILIPISLIATTLAVMPTQAAAEYCASGKKYKYPGHHRHLHMHHHHPMHWPHYHPPHPAAYRYDYESMKHRGKYRAQQDAMQQPAPEPTANILDTAIDAGQFNTLIDAINSAELAETLNGDGPFTVFAPNDDAFAKVPDSIRTAIATDKDALTELLSYHVVSGEVTAADIASLQSATTLQGSELAIDSSNGIEIDGARLVSTDIRATNGIIHVIDSVLIPN